MNTNSASPVYFLLVDDREENLIALEALLRREGLVTLRARSGRQALELLLQYDIALALVDVQMPEMDGFELAELMRGAERTRRVPIIFITAGSTDSRRRFRGYEAGAVDFLTKPIEADVLRSKAEVFFELYRQRQEVARQRDELEAAMKQNARLVESLREADKRKDEFLATLAHELRNPLAPLRTGLQVLRLTPNSDTAQKARAMMERQLSHMVHLIDDLLDVSRISSGKIDLKKERITVKSVLDTATEASRPLLEAGKHELTVRAPDESLCLFADPTRMAQVVSNLLTNAAKYTPQGGKIELSAFREGGRAIILVKDTGIGIPSEMIPRVWDMFVQINRTLDRSQGGLGIGLSIVKRLVQMHGCSVAVDSPGVGQGSTFTIRLPLIETEDAAADSVCDNSERVSGASRRILVVDDNVDAAESLAMMLELLGHQTETAYDGAIGLEVVRRTHPEVAFLDIGMPEMDGYEAARRFRQDPELKRTVLVALTGWGSEEDKRKAREVGFDFHLTKPVEDSTLQDVLSRCAQLQPASAAP